MSRDMGHHSTNPPKRWMESPAVRSQPKRSPIHQHNGKTQLCWNTGETQLLFYRFHRFPHNYLVVQMTSWIMLNRFWKDHHDVAEPPPPNEWEIPPIKALKTFPGNLTASGEHLVHHAEIPTSSAIWHEEPAATLTGCNLEALKGRYLWCQDLLLCVVIRPS